jgi:hypothetical protein
MESELDKIAKTGVPIDKVFKTISKKSNNKIKKKITLKPQKVITSAPVEPIRKKLVKLKNPQMVQPRPVKESIVYTHPIVRPLSKPISNQSVVQPLASYNKPEYSKQVSEETIIMKNFRNLLNTLSADDITVQLDSEYNGASVTLLDISTIPDRKEAMKVFLEMMNSSYGRVLIGEPLFIHAALELYNNRFVRKGVREVYFDQAIRQSRDFMTANGLVSNVNKLMLLTNNASTVLAGCDFIYLDLELLDNIKYNILVPLFTGITQQIKDSQKSMNVLIYSKSKFGLTYEDFFRYMGITLFTTLFQMELGYRKVDDISKVFRSVMSKSSDDSHIKQLTNMVLKLDPSTNMIKLDPSEKEYVDQYNNAIEEANETLKKKTKLIVIGKKVRRDAMDKINDFTQNDVNYDKKNWKITVNKFNIFIAEIKKECTSPDGKSPKKGCTNVLDMDIPKVQGALDEYSSTMKQYTRIPGENTSTAELTAPTTENEITTDTNTLSSPIRNLTYATSSTPATPVNQGTSTKPKQTPVQDLKFNSLDELFNHYKNAQIINRDEKYKLTDISSKTLAELYNDIIESDAFLSDTFAEFKDMISEIIDKYEDYDNVDPDLFDNSLYKSGLDGIRIRLNQYREAAKSIPSGSGFRSKKIKGGSLSQDDELALRDIIDIKSIVSVGKNLYVFSF